MSFALDNGQWHLHQHRQKALAILLKTTWFNWSRLPRRSQLGNCGSNPYIVDFWQSNCSKAIYVKHLAFTEKCFVCPVPVRYFSPQAKPVQSHPSIVQIHENRNLQSSSIPIPSNSWGSKITPKEINTILKSLNSKKAPGIDKIPTKLVKLASDILAEPLSIAINNSIRTSTFPNNAKIATVVPIDKKTYDKYVYLISGQWVY